MKKLIEIPDEIIEDLKIQAVKEKVSFTQFIKNILIKNVKK